ncbi:alpha/beta fold hydrolase [Streptomyces sp. WAC 00631]|uniref:alpha/beta fold hydrolase n=1 Tax=Streptomyces sp. WAC 00631 TaxID=2203201 RepID=UPI000F79E801|nr:alpha/beta hydrolase [Streptomyces sp. WAC 00631]MCC5033255.1 alpha/beta fold hydrolase [Streptomyces sp. WAC 00631]
MRTATRTATRTRAWLAAALTGLLGLGATGFTPGFTPGSAPASAPAGAAHRPPQPAWKRCDFDARLECATVRVPLDHARPRGRTLDLAVSRLAAEGRPRGVLLAVNGGPGGNEGMGRRAPLRFADSPLRSAYDLIGVDLRGTGASSPVHCEVTTPTVPFDSRTPDSSFAGLWADARASEQGCARAGGVERRHIGTVSVARDLDRVRAALGERKLNLIGYAYGSYVAAVYGTLFPHRLDRSVLDSVRHPDWTWRQQFMAQAVAIRENVGDWARWAGRRDGTLGLGGSQRRVMATVERTAAALAERPVNGMNRTAFDATVGSLANDRTRWADLAALVASLEAGDAPSSRAAAAAAETGAGTGAELRPGVLEAATCESSWPREPGVYERDMRRFRERYPYGLGMTRAQPWVCAFRADSPQPPPRIRGAGRPAGLVVQAENDPQTHRAGGAAMAARLGHPLITVADDGSNEIYGRRGYRCVDDRVDRYLLTGRLPDRRHTVCAGAPRPAIAED